MIQKYDVVVVGGGPAGGQTARNLSQKGHKVLLVEKYASFADNNFSSAGMTLEPLEEFQLPKKVIGAYWHHLEIQCTKKSYLWKANEPKGVVLNFQKLREFLVEETQQFGGDVLMAHKYLKKEIQKDGVLLELMDGKTSTVKKAHAKIVVDATGPLRKVMFDEKDEQPQMTLGSGTEYEVQVEQEIYDKFKDKLVFFSWS